MRRRHGGAIVNIGSLHATGGGADRLAYAVSKGGLVTLTINLARALAPDRIRVNCVHPGWVPTDGERVLRREEGRPPGWLEERGRDQPLGRLQTAEDVASMVSFLVSTDADQVTGQVVAVAGRPL
jgi:NAD(P)-dependent dehydrogenase (short-subunit alcohol dehydrogenase family)